MITIHHRIVGIVHLTHVLIYTVIYFTQFRMGKILVKYPEAFSGLLSLTLLIFNV